MLFTTVSNPEACTDPPWVLHPVAFCAHGVYWSNKIVRVVLSKMKVCSALQGTHVSWLNSEMLDLKQLCSAQ